MPSASHPLAVVTGASSGIGFELARQFVDHGYDLIAVAEDSGISGVASLASGGASVDTLQIDLASEDGVDELYAQITGTGRPVAALALNAGVGVGGAFAGRTADETTPLAAELQIIALNVRSVVHLAKHVIADMVARDEGRVLFTSSVESTMPGSYQAVYSGSKSFVQAFALAIRDELKDTNVSITSLMPGPVDTAFFEKADMMDTKVGQGTKDDPADVARQGFEALMNGDERVVAASLSSKVMGKVGRVLPDRVKAAAHSQMSEPGSGEES